MKRTVNIGSQDYTKVICTDGAYHEYEVVQSDNTTLPCAIVHFQNGSIKENGVNGCHQEDLLSIVIDRLQHFQAGEYPCRENALALTKLEEALHWLNHRTQDRKRRGVEGKREQ